MTNMTFTLKISMSDFIGRVNSLSKWFENCRHAVASDLFFARVHKTLWHHPAMAAGVVERILGKEACVSVVGRSALTIANHIAPFDRFGAWMA